MIVRIGKFWLRLLAAALGGVAVLVVAFGVRLAHGPIPVTFLIHPLAQALVPAESGLNADVGSVVVSWGGWQHPLELRALDVRVRRKTGAVALAIPEVDLRPSGWALLHGIFAPERLEVRGGEINLIRHKDGHIDLGLGFSTRASDLGGFIGVLANQFGAEKPVGFARYLRQASIVDATLTLSDRMLGRAWKASDVRLVLSRAPNDGLLGNLSLAVALGSDQAQLVATARYRAAAGRADVQVRVTDLPPAAFASLSPRFADLSEIKVPLSGQLGFSVDRDGKPSAMAFAFQANSGTLSWPGVAQPPVPLRDFAVQGEIAADFGQLRIASATLDVDGLSGLEASGEVTFARNGIGIAAKGGFTDLALAELPRLWPLGLAPSVRKWATENLLAGDAKSGVFRVNIAPGQLADVQQLPEQAVDFRFRFADGTAQYLSPLPPLTGCDGSAHLTATTFDVSLTRGNVGSLLVGDGRMHMSGINVKDTEATTEFVVRGPARAALELLNHPPLGFANKLNIPADKVDGVAAVRVRFLFPVKKHLSLADLKVMAAANLQGFTLPQILDRYRLNEGSLSLKVNNERLEVTGSAALDGVPVTLTWQREFSDKGPYESRYEVVGVFGDEARKTLLFDTTPYVQGLVDSKITIYRSRDRASEIEGHFGLGQAAISIPPLHWKKPARENGSLRIHLTVPPVGPVRINSFSLTTGGSSIQGRATIEKNKLERLDLSDVRYGANSYQAIVTPLQGGGYRVNATGKSFDFTPYIPDLFKPEAGAPPLDFSARFDKLVLDHGEILGKLVATGSRGDGHWRALNIGGSFGATKPFRMTIVPKAAKREIVATSGDAGAVVEGLGLSTNVAGGTLKVTGTFDDAKLGSPLDAVVTLHDFRVQHAPVLARILSLASLGGITALLGGKGIAFSGAEVPLHVSGDAMKVDDARAWGDALGITASGKLDLGKEKLELTGSIIPAYTLNSMVGYIPVIGNLLVGGKGGGIIGFAYSVHGSLAKPGVSVNPLSALAPGFLRQIFEGGGNAGSGKVSLPPPGMDPGNSLEQGSNP